MLKEIQLDNFKCFKRLVLPLGGLNLLCGINGAGKSSLIQALLILRQSHLSGDLLEGRLVLGGELADIGTGSDLLYEYAETDKVSFKLTSSETNRPWSLSFDHSASADLLLAEPKRNHRSPSRVPMQWRTIPPFGGKFVFVSAERLGPRKLHLKSESMARSGNLGIKGEYAFSFLEENRTKTLDSTDPRLRDKNKVRLLDVIDNWLNEISPGAHINLETIGNADAIIAGFYFSKSGDINSRPYRATNVGFGLSYVLPVILSLFSPPGTLVIIENPEAHLHPRGQTKLAELAARATAAGLQVIVETHSDHFLDGIRIAARDGLVESRQVKIHYFERTDGSSIVHSPTLDLDGRLSSWPNGFFDQHDENLANLLTPRK